MSEPAVDKYGYTKKRRLDMRIAQMDMERTTFMPVWRDIGDHVDPVRGRFLITDKSKGSRDNTRIVDGTATFSLQTLEAGMVSGMSSPSRPWFSLTTPYPDLSEHVGVKRWLSATTLKIAEVFQKSGVYECLGLVYGDEALFGTAAMFVEEDDENIIHCHVFPVGSYWLACDSKGRVDTFARELMYTARQIVEKFGEENASRRVRELMDRSQGETQVPIRQIIYPNGEYDGSRGEAQYKRWSECVWEPNSGQDAEDMGKFLRESGYDDFPVMCPRWRTGAEETYGTRCPGMMARGDIKQLQAMAKRAIRSIDKMTSPPLVGSSAFQNKAVSLIPDGLTIADQTQGDPYLRPIHEVRTPLDQLEAMMEQKRAAIRRYFLEDLFLMLASDARAQPPTAEEVRERRAEKYMSIGPVFDSQGTGLHKPLINRTFNIMARRSEAAWASGQDGDLPLPPPELAGVDLHIEYLSTVAQEQKAFAAAGAERLINLVAALSAVWPAAIDKIDPDQTVDDLADVYGAPPTMVRSDEEVADVRQARQAAMAQQQALQAAQPLAKATKDLSQADTTKPSALKQLLGSR